jgi:hypothetical protein
MSPSSSSQKPKNAALMSSKSTSDCHHHWKRKLYPGEEKSVLTDRAEQLFAVGYAACFHSGLLSVAQGRKLDASDSTVTAHVGIGSTGRGGFGLAVALDLHAPRRRCNQACQRNGEGHRDPGCRRARNVSVRLVEHKIEMLEQVETGRTTSLNPLLLSPCAAQAMRFTLRSG